MSKPPTLLIGSSNARENVFSSSFLTNLDQISDRLSDPLDADDALLKTDLLMQTEFLFGSWGMPVLDAKLLEQMPKLKAVFYAAGSIKYFVTDAFWERQIPICAAASANAIPVAEYAFAQIILSLKCFWHYSARLKGVSKYHLKSSDCFGGYRSVVGLTSMGAIGRLLLEKLKTMDLQVMVYDPFFPKDQAKKWGIELVSLDDLFESADVISLHTPWLKETENLIQKSHFLKMKQGSTLINTSRGAIIHEPGMIEALTERPDLWAVLDVTHPEPPLENSPLYSLPNIILTPHIAGSRGKECSRMADWMCEEMSRYLQGEPLQHQVTKEQMARMA